MSLNIELLTIWVSIFGFYFLFAWYFLKIKGIYYTTRSWIYNAYSIIYILMSLLVFHFFLNDFIISLSNSNNFKYFALVFLIFFLSLFTYFMLITIIKPKPSKLKNLYALEINPKFLLSKGIEIIFQQFMIYVLFEILTIGTMPNKIILLTFSLIFGLSHLPLIKMLGKFWGIFFTLCSIMGGYLFAFLLQRNLSNIFITFSMHYAYYTIGWPLGFIFVRNIQKSYTHHLKSNYQQKIRY